MPLPSKPLPIPGSGALPLGPKTAPEIRCPECQKTLLLRLPAGRRLALRRSDDSEDVRVLCAHCGARLVLPTEPS